MCFRLRLFSTTKINFFLSASSLTYQQYNMILCIFCLLPCDINSFSVSCMKLNVFFGEMEHLLILRPCKHALMIQNEVSYTDPVLPPSSNFLKRKIMFPIFFFIISISFIYHHFLILVFFSYWYGWWGVLPPPPFPQLTTALRVKSCYSDCENSIFHA